MQVKTGAMIFCLMINLIGLSRAQLSRPYQPIVLTGDSLSLFLNQPIEKIFLYSYQAEEKNWRLIPFQIDEVNPAYLEAKREIRDSVKYFVAEDSLLGLLDADDEIVFMANDLGDQAADSIWVENTDSNRLEICFTDIIDHSHGFVYVYYSETKDDPIPDDYELNYELPADQVSSTYYQIGFNETGQLSDVSIKADIGGLEQDIFDRFKFRLWGYFIVWPAPTITEDSVKLVNNYARWGKVRIIRNSILTFHYKIRFIVEYEINYTLTQTSFFYPWYGSFKLFEIPIKSFELPIEIDKFRISWDFNQYAEGMKFYSELNNIGTVIDGDSTADYHLDHRLRPAQLNWTMGTGDQGTMLNLFYVLPYADSVGLYYHDLKNGSTGEDFFLIDDSGDLMSYGDNGFFLDNNIENYLVERASLSFEFYNFFLPPNLSPVQAGLICEQMKNPLHCQVKAQKYQPASSWVKNNKKVKPDEFLLVQNYPNPFNSATTISFSLARKSSVSLKIYDSMGRLVCTLIEQDYQPGQHQIKWHGQNDQGATVPSGIYFCKLIADDHSAKRKLIVLR